MAYVNYHVLYKSAYSKSKISTTDTSVDLTLENYRICNKSKIRLIFHMVSLAIVNIMNSLFSSNVNILCRNSVTLHSKSGSRCLA